MIPIITPAEMREIDANAPETLDELIARAAWHVARNARQMLGGVYGRRVIAIAGPGNNGADARVAAGILRAGAFTSRLLHPIRRSWRRPILSSMVPSAPARIVRTSRHTSPMACQFWLSIHLVDSTVSLARRWATRWERRGPSRLLA